MVVWIISIIGIMLGIRKWIIEVFVIYLIFINFEEFKYEVYK